MSTPPEKTRQVEKNEKKGIADTIIEWIGVLLFLLAVMAGALIYFLVFSALPGRII